MCITIYHEKLKEKEEKSAHPKGREAVAEIVDFLKVPKKARWCKLSGSSYYEDQILSQPEF